MTAAAPGRVRLAWWEGTEDSPRLMVDGDHVADLPRTAADGEGTVYVCGPPRWEALAALCRPGDTLTGELPGKPDGLTLATPYGPVRWAPGAAWGLSWRPLEAAHELAEISGTLASIGERWAWSASSLARRLLRRHTPDEERGQLRARWRPLAAAAVHQGPLHLGRAADPEVVELDQRAAYLRGLAEPLPTRDGWRPGPRGLLTCGGRSLPLDKPGLYAAAVDVPRPKEGAPGPLPQRDGAGRVSWPWGLVVGTWSAPVLRAALAAGARVLVVFDSAVGAESRWGEAVAAALDGLPAVLRKRTYTRAWGCWAYPGRWRCLLGELAGGGGDGAVVDPAGKVWTADPTVAELLSPHGGQLYRPDAAGVVAGRNVETVMGAVREAGPDVCAVLVDAVWVRARSADAVDLSGEGWVVKRRGEWRGYAPGWYDHAEKRARMGLPEWRQEEAAARVPRWVLPGLTGWAGDPRIDPGAVWSAPEGSAWRDWRAPAPAVRWRGWSPAGWVRGGAEPERQRRIAPPALAEIEGLTGL